MPAFCHCLCIAGSFVSYTGKAGSAAVSSCEDSLLCAAGGPIRDPGEEREVQFVSFVLDDENISGERPKCVSDKLVCAHELPSVLQGQLKS